MSIYNRENQYISLLAQKPHSIKELAETRAKALNAPQEGEESEGDV